MNVKGAIRDVCRVATKNYRTNCIDKNTRFREMFAEKQFHMEKKSLYNFLF